MLSWQPFGQQPQLVKPIFFVAPIGVIYDVHDDDRLVSVANVWVI